MKKLLLAAFGLAGACLSTQVHAQLSENFNGSTSALPGTWITINDANTPSTTTLSATAQTKMASAGWHVSVTKGNADPCAFSISTFATPATADRWLISPAFTVPTGQYLTWEDFSLQTPADSVEVYVSPTAGTTAASFTQKIYSGPAPDANSTGTYANKHLASLATWAGTSVRIAFREHSTNKLLLYVDNVATQAVPSAEMAMLSLSPNSGTNAAFVKSGSPVTLTGTVKNNGANAITSYTLNYKVNSGSVVSMPMTASIAPFATASFSASTPFTASSGNNVVKAWVSLTGDTVPSNDSGSTTVVGIDSIQTRQVLLEEFTNASCDPCAANMPNLDSVCDNNKTRMYCLRYHVWYPGRDCMDSVTITPFVQYMANTYYAVSGVPDSKMNGYMDVYPGASQLKTSLVNSEYVMGSPFKITPHASYNKATKTFTVSADVKAYAAFPAGLTLRAALSVDTLTYAANQSQETIPQYRFLNVVENMFGGTSGTALGAFTAGQTQSIPLTWTKDHPWASDYKDWKYDSSAYAHVTFWVQNNTTKNVFQSASIAVAASTVGVESVAGKAGSISVYPNPATTEATVSVKLNQSATVAVEIFDMAGRMVYSVPAAKRASGASSIDINTSNLAAGSYIVNVKLDDETVSQKLEIAK